MSANKFMHFLIAFSCYFRFPLYSKGKEGTKFFYGTFLLNKDIAQVGFFLFLKNCAYNIQFAGRPQGF